MSFLLALVGAVASGCNGQSEGESCLQNSDCASGLTCVTPPVATVLGMRCCPATPMSAACGFHQNGIDASSAAPGDGASSDAPSGEAADDAATSDATPAMGADAAEAAADATGVDVLAVSDVAVEASVDATLGPSTTDGAADAAPDVTRE